MTRAHRDDPIHLHRLAKFAFRRYNTARARREIERADQYFQVVDRVNRLDRCAGVTLPNLPSALIRHR